jgi:hypothetical protein
MKSAAISRFVVVAAVLALMVTVGATPMSAQITFTDFSSTTGLQLNGAATAALNGNLHVLRVAPAVPFQAGSAFFTTPQPVAGAFSTTFKFQLNGSTSSAPGDGFAFLIQNSGTGALDPDVNGTDGCSIGFGDAPNGTCTGHTGGITNSIAVEFDTYENDDIGDMNSNHVLIQSCGTGANSVDSLTCFKAGNYNVPVVMSDGTSHTVVISFTPSGSCTSASCVGILDVIIDNNDLFPATGDGANPVTLDMAAINPPSTPSSTAYVGFTAATGGANDNQDILSWTFTPQQQSGVIDAGAATPTVLNYSGGPTNGTNGNTGYEYDLQLDSNSSGNSNPDAVTGSVTAIVMDQKSCNKLVQKKFPLTQCFVFQNADGKGNSGAVLFELTCPDFNGGTTSNCGDTNLNNFAAALGTSFSFVKSQNPGFQLLNSTIGPYPGWLKGDGGTPGHPCTPPSTGSLFQSNQISSFNVAFDPLGTTKGKSGGGGSCWVATYATTGELPPGIKISAPAFKTYPQSSTAGVATYTCSDPVTSFRDATGKTGPYLTAATCSQSQAPNRNNSSCSVTNNSGVISCTGTYDLSVRGLHVFTVTSKDTGGNVGANVVIYNVR